MIESDVSHGGTWIRDIVSCDYCERVMSVVSDDPDEAEIVCPGYNTTKGNFCQDCILGRTE